MSAIGDKSHAIGDSFEATVFSDYAIKLLDKGILSGIFLKDERFGNIDDIVFEINNNILHCIQAKASRTSDEINLGFFINIKKNKIKSLFQGLYDSYEKLKKNFINYHIKVEFITNKFPSSSTRGLPKEGNRKISLASFIREIWRPYKNKKITKNEIISDRLYKKFIERLSEHLGISIDEIFEFFEHFDFIFNYIPNWNRSYDENKKIEEYFNWFLLTKKNPRRTGYISLDEFRKDISFIIEPNPHDFPIDIANYICFSKLNEEINKAINSLNRGYIFLQGGPSTGKSTFLEAEINTINLPNCIIFKYLCFREPNELSIRSRGELKHFIEDLKEQFKLYISGFSETEIERKFIEYLKKLSNYAQKEDKKIIIIIDGIDHISREEILKIDKPFYLFLLIPDSLPENIIFLVAGQHFKDISWYQDSIKTNLCFEFKIPHFDKNDIENYLRNFYSYNETIEYDILNILHSKTQGNPYYLKVICQNYNNFHELNNSIEIINENFEVFEEDWNKLYEKYWNIFGFNSNPRFKEIAGLISRIRGPIDISWLQKWPESREIELFINKFRFFFKRYGNVLLFDHNSFKNYLNNKGTQYLGESLNAVNLKLYRILAERCNLEETKEYHNWIEIYYLKEANLLDNYEINRDVFLKFWNQGRPVFAIIEDLRILLEFYFAQRDIETIFKIMLLKMEFEVRRIHMEYDNNSGNPFLINPSLLDSKSDYLYLISFTLYSNEIPNQFKLNYINRILSNYSLDFNIIKLLNYFFIYNKENLIVYEYNPTVNEKNWNTWLQIASFFEKDNLQAVKEGYNIVLTKFEKELRERLDQEEIYRLLNILGKFLVERKNFEDLDFVYDILYDIIDKEEWRVYGNEDIYLKNKYKDYIFPNYYNPFLIIFELTRLESIYRNNDLIKELFEINRNIRDLFENSESYSWHKLRFCPEEINESDLLKFFEDGPIITTSYSKRADASLNNRIYLYQKLKELLDINEEKILSIFNQLKEARDLKKPDFYKKFSIKILWEYDFFQFAINLNKKYDKFEESLPLRNSIQQIFNRLEDASYYNDEHGVRIFINFSAILKTIIQKIKTYSFLHNWFIDTLIDFFENSKCGFKNIRSQIEVSLLILEEFNLINLEIFKNIINNAKNSINLENLDGWNASYIILQLLKLISYYKKEDPNFYEENLRSLLNLLEIFNFRLLPRKDWQLYALTYFIDKTISYFEPNNKKFLRDLDFIVKALNYSHYITERSEIWAIKDLIHKSLLNWDEKIAKNIYLQFELYKSQPRSIIEREEEEYNFPRTDVVNLIENIKKPLKFFKNVCDKITELEFQKRLNLNYSNIFERIKNSNEISEDHLKNLYEYLIKESKISDLRKSKCFRFYTEFFSFYKKIAKSKGLNEKEINKLKLEIELATLRPSTYEFFSDSLDNLYNLNKEKCFEYGLEVFYNLFIKLGKPILYYSYHDFLMLTFLSKINESNYYKYWNMYITYLRNLFKLIDYL